MFEALALNQGGAPMDIMPWKRAVTLWSLGKAVVLEEYREARVRSIRLVLQLPAVIRCLETRTLPRHYTKVLPLNRRNLFLRDGGCCVYCGKAVSFSSYTIDHVVPKSQGGGSTWENLVAACSRCNNRKGGRRYRADELSMHHRPFVPRLPQAAPRALVQKLGFRRLPEAWKAYLPWSAFPLMEETPEAPGAPSPQPAA